jgi:UDP-glucuronate 4-epimerase
MIGKKNDEMTILVTGGAGFIGSHLVERLLNHGNRVIVLDDFNNYYSPSIKRKNIDQVIRHPKYKLIEGDIRDNLDNLFEENKISMVVHLAARAGVRPSLIDPMLYNSVNVSGTLNLLEYCKKYNVKKFVFASSSSVYGITSKVPFKEDDILEHPVSPYAVTKIAGENLCRVYHSAYGMSIFCLRFFTVYGPRQRPEMAIHKFVKMISNGESIPYYGDGTSARDYTFISDILDGILASIKTVAANDNLFEVINLGDSNKVTLKELVCIIEESIGKKAKLEFLPNQKGDVPVTYADISKAEKLVGYKPKINIEDGIKLFMEWYRAKE